MSKAAALCGPAGEAAVLAEIDRLQLEIPRLRKETRARLERIKRS